VFLHESKAVGSVLTLKGYRALTCRGSWSWILYWWDDRGDL